MNQDLKTKWVEALRSGNYKQGQHRLRSSQDEFCCLGVLCDVVDPNGWYSDAGSWMYAEANAYLPMDLRDRLGIDSADESRLGVMNDKWKRDFNQIADHIEEWL